MRLLLRTFLSNPAQLLLPGVVALLAACATEPANPFVGLWTTAEHEQITFRPDTIVVNPPGVGPTAMARETCSNAFSFDYRRMSRDALLGLTPQQPDLRRRLAARLLQPEYPVAELTCGEGNSTYVLLGERELLVIHRDRNIAGIEELSRI